MSKSNRKGFLFLEGDVRGKQATKGGFSFGCVIFLAEPNIKYLMFPSLSQGWDSWLLVNAPVTLLVRIFFFPQNNTITRNI